MPLNERSRIQEWHLWEILTEEKRSPKPFFDSEAKTAGLWTINSNIFVGHLKNLLKEAGF